jgi:hypothetical protein
MDPTRTGRPEERPATYVHHDVDLRVRHRSDFLRVLCNRRRVSRALDDLCGIERAEIDLSVGDYWHDVHMDLDVSEREIAGRVLAGAP